jgi:hypothetical protein
MSAIRIAISVGALLVAVSAAPGGIVFGQQVSDVQRKKGAIGEPTAAQAAAHRQARERRHETFKMAIEKARAGAEAARRAFLDKQRAALDAENAKVMAEIARLRIEPPELKEP